MRITRQYLITLAAISSLLFSSFASALDEPYPGPFVENEDLLMILIPHTPEQMTAFYEARGFPKAALDKIAKVCFVTVHIENKSQRVVWLETKNWDLAIDGEPIQRINKQQWTNWWDDINLPNPYRSTFGWTQLPAVRDLHPGEPVGGNIILEGDVKHFDLQARFYTGQDKRNGMLDIQFRNIECPKQEASP